MEYYNSSRLRMRPFKLFLLLFFCSGMFYIPNANEAGCTYCYQIASVEITFRNRKVQHGYISWSPNQDSNITAKGFLEEAKKKQRIRFFKNISKQSTGSDENEVSVYYALARNVMLLRRYDIKNLRIINPNFGATKADIQIIKKWR
jgi:hypothetical protein